VLACQIGLTHFFSGGLTLHFNQIKITLPNTSKFKFDSQKHSTISRYPQIKIIKNLVYVLNPLVPFGYAKFETNFGTHQQHSQYSYNNVEFQLPTSNARMEDARSCNTKTWAITLSTSA
jgi:hypothetical protein